MKSCGPFLNNEYLAYMNAEKAGPSEPLPAPKLRPCPDITSINSIVKLNNSHALMFIGGTYLEYVHVNRYGYALMPEPHTFRLALDSLSTYVDFGRSSMINLNRILFVFQVRPFSHFKFMSKLQLNRVFFLRMRLFGSIRS